MAITLNDAIARCQLYADTISGRIDDSTWTMFLNDYIRKSATNYNLPWLKRKTQLIVYPEVLEYAAPSDYRDMVQPEKLVGDGRRDDSFFLYETQRGFARNQHGRNDFSVDFNAETKFLNVRYNEGTGQIVTLQDCDDLTANGTWAISGGSNLTIDTSIYRHGGGSLKFDVTVAGTVTLTCTSMPAQDLSTHKNISKLFEWLYLPVSGATSVTLKWGSDASNYYSVSSTTQNNGAAFGTFWNLIGHAWDGATQTGTPDDTAIAYLQISIANAGVGNNYRLDYVTSRLPYEFELHYYSKYGVKTNAGAYQETLVSGDDQLLGDTEFEDCAVLHAVNNAAMYKLKDADLAAVSKTELNERTNALKAKYPNMSPRPQVVWYNQQLLD